MTIDLWETPLNVTRSLTTPCLQNILRLRAFNVCHDKMDSTYISDFSPGPLLYIHLHPLHLFLNRGDLLGTTDDFTTSFLHFSLFSTALWDFAKSRPMHSLMLSSHLFSVCFVFFPLSSRSGELRTQKLKSHLLRTQSLKVLPLKSGVGEYIAMHATLTARNFFLANFYPSGQFTYIFSKPLPLKTQIN